MSYDLLDANIINPENESIQIFAYFFFDKNVQFTRLIVSMFVKRDKPVMFKLIYFGIINKLTGLHKQNLLAQNHKLPPLDKIENFSLL